MINQTESVPNVRSVAVIGSGMTGLSAALLLQQRGCSVRLYEKSRGPGGRLASKRVTGGSADVGAQYFTIRNPAFEAFLNQYAGPEAFQPWSARFGYQKGPDHWDSFPDETRYVGVPRMTALSRALSSHVSVQAETRIAGFHRSSEGWRLVTTQGTELGPFDALVVTAPPAQTQDLLKDSGMTDLAAEMAEPVRHVQPCWAVAAHFNQPPYERFDGMRPQSEILSWVANNSSKPGRDDTGQWWVLHGDPDWSHANQDSAPETVADRMIAEFQALTGTALQPDEVVTHRWLYAKSSGGEAPGYHWYAEQQLGLAGDWLDGGRVEGAFNSASALVSAMENGR